MAGPGMLLARPNTVVHGGLIWDRSLWAAQLRLTAFRAIGRPTGMTQQNETQQQGVAAPGPQPPEQPASVTQPDSAHQPASATAPASPAPPPSLFGYEDLPDAYLAPPQPGQPSYGTPPHPGGRPFAARPGYGRPGPGQPGYGQPAPGQPGYGGPGYGR